MRRHNGFAPALLGLAGSTERLFILAAGFFVLAAFPAFANPVSFPECPAVGDDTSGCELLITVTAVNGSGDATAITVTTSNPDQGSYDGGDGTLIGVLNSSTGTLGSLTLSSSLDIFGFDLHGACLGTESSGSLVSAYSPGPTAAECLEGKYQTTDAMDYASAGVTFNYFYPPYSNGDSGTLFVDLAPGASSWFSLPGAITAGEITLFTPEPNLLWLLGVGIIGLALLRRSKAI